MGKFDTKIKLMIGFTLHSSVTEYLYILLVGITLEVGQKWCDGTTLTWEHMLERAGNNWAN